VDVTVNDACALPCVGAQVAGPAGKTALGMHLDSIASWTFAEPVPLVAGQQINAAGSAISVTWTSAFPAVPTPYAFAVPANAWRCDQIAISTTSGCVAPDYPDTVTFDSAKTPKVDVVARHVLDAINAGAPGGIFGSNPLHKADKATTDANRSAVCPTGSPTDGVFTSCDEYPFASTIEGGPGPHSSTRPVPLGSNSSQGGTLSSFYQNSRVIPGDALYVWAVIDPNPVNRVMVVGDSISEGLEGDFTWRYRLWQDMVTAETSVNFVGPWTGTNYISKSTAIQHDGSYRTNATWPKGNLAQWGWQMHQAKDFIASAVASNQPTTLLVELGFNDLGWGVSTPAGLYADLQLLISNARSANSTLKIAIANVPQRSPLAVNPSLPATISSYNSLLASNISSLSTSGSPVTLVDLAGVYSYATDTYDGLHPNPAGEFKIASAFNNALVSSFGISAVRTISPSIPAAINPASPTSMTATPTSSGIALTWSHSYAATGYWLYSRDVTAGGAFARSALAIGQDFWNVGNVIRTHSYQYYVRAAHGDYEAPAASPIASAIANPLTTDPPTGITVTPAAASTKVSWIKPTGTGATSVLGYNVYWVDAADNALHQAYTASTSMTLSSVVAGHTYNVAVGAVNAYGEGQWGGGPSWFAGYGAPAKTTLTSVTHVSTTSAKLVWTAVPHATGYWIYQRSTSTGAYVQLPYELPASTTTFTGGYLVPSALTYWFCVQAANGSARAPMSNCLQVK
jgi:lysophospholipase L1-like esterase